MKTTINQQPTIGILADDLVQQHHLRAALSNFGFAVVINTTPQQQSVAGLSALPDAWVVDVHGEDDATLAWLDTLLSNKQPVLLGVETAPNKHSSGYPKWEKRLYSKLHTLNIALPQMAADSQQLKQIAQSPSSKPQENAPELFSQYNFNDKTAQHVWLLGASMGGPNAVKEFFDALPAQLPVAFIYAQHIDPTFEATLGQTIGRHSQYRFKNFTEGDSLNYGEVLVAPIEHEFYFDEHKQLRSKNSLWPGPYGPSIDQTILNINQAFTNCAGYIIFSGMGNDGAEAITELNNDRLEIWAQTPTSCASSSMPESAIATGKVNFIGTPQELAQQLVNHLKQQWEINHG